MNGSASHWAIVALAAVVLVMAHAVSCQRLADPTTDAPTTTTVRPSVVPARNNNTDVLPAVFGSWWFSALASVAIFVIALVLFAVIRVVRNYCEDTYGCCAHANAFRTDNTDYVTYSGGDDQKGGDDQNMDSGDRDGGRPGGGGGTSARAVSGPVMSLNADNVAASQQGPQAAPRRNSRQAWNRELEETPRSVASEKMTYSIYEDADD